jgi:hypothetical protein
MLQGLAYGAHAQQYHSRCFELSCTSKGFNACWVPGTDGSRTIATAKVVAKLKSEGINKADLTREEF